MRSYIKIYGPPILKAMKSLEKVAFDMPDVCIMDMLIETSLMPLDSDEAAYTYFNDSFGSTQEPIPLEGCSKIISKSGVKVREFDFYFEWAVNPTQEELNKLIEKIDSALMPLGCNYKITTKPR